MSRPPDYLAPFIGWKGLVVKPDTGALLSPARRVEWPARERFEATCSKGHATPSARCTCGVYAVRSFEELAKAHYNWDEFLPDADEVWVVAEIKLWGQIRKGAIGYRAQFGYPKRVYVPGHKLALAQKIRQRYGCAIGVIDRFTGERR